MHYILDVTNREKSALFFGWLLTDFGHRSLILCIGFILARAGVARVAERLIERGPMAAFGGGADITNSSRLVRF